MNYQLIDIHYLDEAVQLAQENYMMEKESVGALFDKDYKNELQELLSKIIQKQFGIMAVDDDGSLIGYLCFNKPNNTYIADISIANSPIYGYAIRKGYDRGKIISLLFQHSSEILLNNNVGFFEIKVYAHDKDVITSFVLNQFGILCTDVIKMVDDPIITSFSSGLSFNELNKDDIAKNKSSLLSLWRQLVKHLQSSPTYYPGIEFTDEVYWEYINDVSTRLFVVKDNKNIVGMLNASQDGNCFANHDDKTMNVGDLYIQSSYRGKNIAQELLQYTNDLFKS